MQVVVPCAKFPSIPSAVAAASYELQSIALYLIEMGILREILWNEFRPRAFRSNLSLVCAGNWICTIDYWHSRIRIAGNLPRCRNTSR